MSRKAFLEVEAGSKEAFYARKVLRAKIRALLAEVVGIGLVDQIGLDPAYTDLLSLLSEEVLMDPPTKAKILSRIAARAGARTVSTETVSALPVFAEDVYHYTTVRPRLAAERKSSYLMDSWSSLADQYRLDPIQIIRTVYVIANTSVPKDSIKVGVRQQPKRIATSSASEVLGFAGLVR